MDKSTRNSIQRATQAARKLLEDTYREQLEGTYDILLDGTVADTPGDHLSDGQKIIREKLVAAIDHKRSAGLKPKEAVNAYLREAAFTTLNRFVALKMLEARQLVQECVSKGEDSIGFKEFSALAPGLTALPDKGYRLFIETLFDEIGQEVKVLFDRRDVASLLWPDRQKLLDLLGLLNSVELAEVWAEDETIGWVYQYFNGDDERSKMREESQAPRNSRELAVRNQFFTPRYVVQFLTDNTLGRTWYEMMQGETTLAQLDYLVRRPNEVFLAEGEEPPASDDDDSDISQEELLNKTVYIPFRPKKDPRDLRILDPACGSGHFLLYAFDLLVSIYEEAWMDPDLGPGLWELVGFEPQVGETQSGDVADPDSVILTKPDEGKCFSCGRKADQFILADLYGTPFTAGRPMIYCAECAASKRDKIIIQIPLSEFSYKDSLKAGWFASSTGTVFVDLAGCFEFRTGGPQEGMFEKLECAAQEENRQLIRAALPKLIIEHNLHGIDIAPRAAQIAALALWMRAQRAYNQFEIARDQRPPITKTNIVVAEPMPGDAELVEEFAAGLKPTVLGELFKKMVEEMKLAGELGSLLKIEESLAKAVDDAAKAHRQGGLFGEKMEGEGFWNTVDEKVIAALGAFAETATGSARTRRRLFAEDATQGVAFIELMRKRFDVVLMNPPFGEGTTSTSSRIAADYSNSKHDLAATFVARSDTLAPSGLIGVIATRSLLLMPGAAKWRAEIRKQRTFALVADLGTGVLDATVEAFAGVLQSAAHSATRSVFLRRYGAAVKDPRELIIEIRSGDMSPDIYLKLPDDFKAIPLEPIAYWISTDLLRLFRTRPSFEPTTGVARTGLATLDNFRFLRCWWEVPSENSDWVVLSKGGDSHPYFWDHDQRVWWKYGGRELKTYVEAKVGSISRKIQAQGWYFLPGVTWIQRSQRGFCARAHPSKALFDTKGPTAFPKNKEDLYPLLGIMNSALFQEMLDLQSSFGSYHPGVVQRAPSPLLDDKLRSRLTMATKRAHRFAAELAVCETSVAYHGPRLLKLCDSNADIAEKVSNDPVGQRQSILHSLLDSIGEIEALTHEAYGLVSTEQIEARKKTARNRWSEMPLGTEEEFQLEAISWAVGVAFGRWSRQPKSRAVDFSAFGQMTAPTMMDATKNITGIMVTDPGHEADLPLWVESYLKASFSDQPSFVASSFNWFEEAVDHAELRKLLTSSSSGSFFDYHINLYSRSRRKAPIYWQLSTPSASYSVWCYYHHLISDTFFRIENDYIAPKVDHEERKLNDLRQEAGKDPSSKQRKAINAQEAFVEELRAFKTEVARIAPLWNPNLNDGVIINFAPLWRLVPQHKPWQKECKKVWDKLVKGDYDWAHLAMHLWPERVVPKCAKDRSLAIAHGLEEDFWYEDDDGKWHKRQMDAEKVEELISERASTAVKAALNDLLAAPTPGGGRKARKGGKRG